MIADAIQIDDGGPKRSLARSISQRRITISATYTQLDLRRAIRTIAIVKLALLDDDGTPLMTWSETDVHRLHKLRRDRNGYDHAMSLAAFAAQIECDDEVSDAAIDAANRAARTVWDAVLARSRCRASRRHGRSAPARARARSSRRQRSIARRTSRRSSSDDGHGEPPRAAHARGDHDRHDVSCIDHQGAVMRRGGLPPRPLTADEAAAYCGFKTSAGIRTAVRRGQIKPCGRGARNRLLFSVGDLDAFLRNRALAYGYGRECSPDLGRSTPRRESPGAPQQKGELHAPGARREDQVSGDLQPERRNVSAQTA